jgi:hypothetical protein
MKFVVNLQQNKESLKAKEYMLNLIKLIIKFNQMEEILGHYFKDVEDPRSLRNQRHSLMPLIGTTLLAVLSGIDSFIVDHIKIDEDFA